LSNIETCAHLTQWDTAHGRINYTVTIEENHLVINNNKIAFFSSTSPKDLPWQQLQVDVVLECTGLFKSRQLAGKHLKAGAKKVLISAPADGQVDATVVYGVNDDILSVDDKIVSNASCTTNCLSPVVRPIHEAIGIEHGLVTCIHAYTNDQVLTDTFHNDLRRARSATMSQIPTSTGAANVNTNRKLSHSTG